MKQTIVAKSPQFFSEAELRDFIAMVHAGGEVDGDVLERNVRNAQCLVFLRRGPCLTGVAALKNPLPSYRQSIQSKSGAFVATSDFPFELGYVFVLPSARRQGFSKKIVQAALKMSATTGVFATVRTGNLGMRSTLKKFGFAKVGASYASRQGDYQLQLFVLPAAQKGKPKVSPS